MRVEGNLHGAAFYAQRLGSEFEDHGVHCARTCRDAHTLSFAGDTVDGEVDRVAVL